VPPEELIRQSKVVRELAGLGAIPSGNKYKMTKFSQFLDNRAEKRDMGRILKVNPNLAAFRSLSARLRLQKERL
jgi:hypothetical protein